MVVGIDGRSLQSARGVWRYLAPTLGALAAAMPDDELRILAPGDAPLTGVPQAPNVTLVRPPANSRAFYARSALLRRPRIDRCLGAPDVFWLPANHPSTVSDGVPLVLTIHDLSFDVRPRDFTWSDRLNHRITNARAQARRADRILVTTCAVRDEVVAAYGVDAGRIDVVAPGISRPAQPLEADAIAAARARYGLPERYVLQVGALEPRKQPDLLARAAARAGLPAVFAGEGRLVAVLAGPGVHLLGHVPDDDLDLLYAGALVLAYPSLLEGYGFPPQEAALRGTAAVVSDLPALREVLGDGARFVPPGDEDALAAALAELEADDAARADLAARAYAHAAPRTWAAAGAGVAATLRRAAPAPA
ncbi:glycosyltransferase [Svornostia abyssi]|uniref:Glycosyltransferase n=1 Tax=Svornostia abyssi TaxID=2898438 RepID=A0ABY5PKY4_9ACTN|nr:glycosyltransferase [Parviterribacteraceae bacterium J379]